MFVYTSQINPEQHGIRNASDEHPRLHAIRQFGNTLHHFQNLISRGESDTL
jgi:hypothetical protein